MQGAPPYVLLVYTLIHSFPTVNQVNRVFDLAIITSKSKSQGWRVRRLQSPKLSIHFPIVFPSFPMAKVHTKKTMILIIMRFLSPLGSRTNNQKHRQRGSRWCMWPPPQFHRWDLGREGQFSKVVDYPKM